MPLTLEQYHTAKAAKQLSNGGPITREILKQAHKVGYPNLANANSSTVASYVSTNLKSPAFTEALKPFAVE